MRRRQLIKTVGATATGGAILGAAQPAAAGNLVWDSYSGYSYLKFTPSDGASGAPLVVGLHGCSQEPDDFAEAMQIDYWGDEFGYAAIFPNQNDLYNWADCWNWYYDSNCDRGSGSGSSIADIYRHERSQLGTDRNRGYILGFSAGGAFVPNLVVNYSDLYAAAGVHSGVEYDAADSATEATYVMENGGPDPHDQGWYAYDQMRDLGITDYVPTIVFQGKEDTTVEPPNGKQSAIQAATADYYVNGGGVDYTLSMADHSSGCSGHCYDRYEFTDGSGRVHADLWRIDNMGHDWAGGASSRVYTDPDAPEATYHMFDYFRNWSN